MAHITTVLKTHHSLGEEKSEISPSNKKDRKVQSLTSGNQCKLPWKAPPVFLSCHLGRPIYSPWLEGGSLRVTTPKETGRSFACSKVRQGLEGEGKARDLELKRKSSQCSWSFCWARSRKAMPVNTYISRLSQPALFTHLACYWVILGLLHQTFIFPGRTQLRENRKPAIYLDILLSLTSSWEHRT